MPLSNVHKKDFQVVKVTVAVKREVLDRLLKGPEWSKKLNHVKSSKDYAKLLKDYSKAKKLKVHVLA